jgi:hypothetical protein
MDNPFSWSYQTTVPGTNEVLGPFAIVFVIIFGLGFLASIVVYNGGGRKLFRTGVLFRMARKWAGIGLALFGAGLFFFAIRVLQINPFTFGMRFWLWLSILAFFFYVGYIVYDYKKNYQKLLKAHDEQRRRQQYLRAGGAGMIPTRENGAAVPAGPPPRPVRRRKP